MYSRKVTEHISHKYEDVCHLHSDWQLQAGVVTQLASRGLSGAMPCGSLAAAVCPPASLPQFPAGICVGSEGGIASL